MKKVKTPKYAARVAEQAALEQFKERLLAATFDDEPAYFKSNKDDWETPDNFFAALNERYRFTLDVCASADNAKCKRFFTKEDDALAQDWGKEVCWMNPPYGRHISEWLHHARIAAGLGATVVALLPARTDTAWWHEHVMRRSSEVYFVKGRLKFKGAASSAPFPSAVVVWRPKPRTGTIGGTVAPEEQPRVLTLNRDGSLIEAPSSKNLWIL